LWRAPRSRSRHSKVCPTVSRPAVPVQETSAARNPAVWIATTRKEGAESAPRPRRATPPALFGSPAAGADTNATLAEQSGTPTGKALQRQPECKTKRVGRVDTG